MPTQDNAEINSINARMLAERIGSGATDWGKIFQEDTANEVDSRELSQEMKRALDNLLDSPPMPNPELVTIPVSEEIYIQYDCHDTWFALADRDNLGYDEMGAVVMGFDEIDRLIQKLQEFRARIVNNGTIQPNNNA